MPPLIPHSIRLPRKETRAPSTLPSQDKLRDKSKGDPAVLRIELLQRASIWHFQAGQQNTFLRVVMSLPNLVAPARCGCAWRVLARFGGVASFHWLVFGWCQRLA
jgi:hypothetical protein